MGLDCNCICALCRNANGWRGGKAFGSNDGVDFSNLDVERRNTALASCSDIVLEFLVLENSPFDSSISAQEILELVKHYFSKGSTNISFALEIVDEDKDKNYHTEFQQDSQKPKSLVCRQLLSLLIQKTLDKLILANWFYSCSISCTCSFNTKLFAQQMIESMSFEDSILEAEYAIKLLPMAFKNLPYIFNLFTVPPAQSFFQFNKENISLQSSQKSDTDTQPPGSFLWLQALVNKGFMLDVWVISRLLHVAIQHAFVDHGSLAIDAIIKIISHIHTSYGMEGKRRANSLLIHISKLIEHAFDFCISGENIVMDDYIYAKELFPSFTNKESMFFFLPMILDLRDTPHTILRFTKLISGLLLSLNNSKQSYFGTLFYKNIWSVITEKIVYFVNSSEYWEYSIVSCNRYVNNGVVDIIPEFGLKTPLSVYISTQIELVGIVTTIMQDQISSRLFTDLTIYSNILSKGATDNDGDAISLLLRNSLNLCTLLQMRNVGLEISIYDTIPFMKDTKVPSKDILPYCSKLFDATSNLLSKVELLMNLEKDKLSDSMTIILNRLVDQLSFGLLKWTCNSKINIEKNSEDSKDKFMICFIPKIIQEKVLKLNIADDNIKNSGKTTLDDDSLKCELGNVISKCIIENSFDIEFLKLSFSTLHKHIFIESCKLSLTKETLYKKDIDNLISAKYNNHGVSSELSGLKRSRSSKISSYETSPKSTYSAKRSRYNSLTGNERTSMTEDKIEVLNDDDDDVLVIDEDNEMQEIELSDADTEPSSEIPTSSQQSLIRNSNTIVRNNNSFEAKGLISNIQYIKHKCFSPYIDMIKDLQIFLSELLILIYTNNDAKVDILIGKIIRISDLLAYDTKNIFNNDISKFDTSLYNQILSLQKFYKTLIFFLYPVLLEHLYLLKDYCEHKNVIHGTNKIFENHGISWLTNIITVFIESKVCFELIMESNNGKTMSDSSDILSKSFPTHLNSVFSVLEKLYNFFDLDFNYKIQHTGHLKFPLLIKKTGFLAGMREQIDHFPVLLFWTSILIASKNYSKDKSEFLDFKRSNSISQKMSSTSSVSSHTSSSSNSRLNFGKWCAFSSNFKLPEMINKESFIYSETSCNENIISNISILYNKMSNFIFSGQNYDFLLPLYEFIIESSHFKTSGKNCVCDLTLINIWMNIYLDYLVSYDEDDYLIEISENILNIISLCLERRIRRLIKYQIELTDIYNILGTFIKKLIIFAQPIFKRLIRNVNSQNSSVDDLTSIDSATLTQIANVIKSILSFVFMDITTLITPINDRTSDDVVDLLFSFNLERIKFASTVSEVNEKYLKHLVIKQTSNEIPLILDRKYLISALSQLVVNNDRIIADEAIKCCIKLIDFQRQQENPRWDESIITQVLRNCSGNGVNIDLLKSLYSNSKEEDKLQVLFLQNVTGSFASLNEQNVSDFDESIEQFDSNKFKSFLDNRTALNSLFNGIPNPYSTDTRLNNMLNALQSLYINSQSETICGDVLVYLCLQLAVSNGRQYNSIRVKLQEIATLNNCTEDALLFPLLKEISVNIFARVIKTAEQVLTYRSFGPFPNFLRVVMNFILPRLVLSQKTVIIESLSKTLGVTVQELLLDKVGYIFAYILVKHKQHVTKTVEYYCKYAGISSIGPALRSAQFPLIKEITLQLKLPKSNTTISNNKDSITHDLSKKGKPAKRAIFRRIDSVPSVFNREISSTNIKNTNDMNVIEEEDDAVRALNTVREFLKEDKDTSEDSREAILIRYGGNSLSSYLYYSFVGLLNEVATQIDPENPKVTLKARISSLAAFGRLITLTGSIVNTFEPQIRTILEMALKNPDLRSYALNTWHIFLDILESKDLEPLLDTICISLCKGIEDFSTFHQMLVAETLEDLLLNKQRTMQAKLENLCLLPVSKVDIERIPLFLKLNQVLLDSRVKKSPMDQFSTLLPKVGDTDPAVVTSALESILTLLKMHEIYFASIFIDDGCDAILKRSIQILLETSGRFLGSDPNVSLLSAKCLGAIGAVDPGRIDFEMLSTNNSLTDNSNFKKSTPLVEDLQAPEMMLQYVFKLLNIELAPGARSAGSQRLQKNMAFATQELLKLVGFTPEVVSLAESDQSNLSSTNAMALASIQSSSKHKHLLEVHVKLWRRFNPKNLPILRSLLKSNFSRQKTVYNKKDTVFFTRVSTFSQWLQLWVVELIKRMPESNIRSIFECCTGSIQSGGISVAQFILPQVLLNTLTIGSEADCKFLEKELQIVLAQTTSSQDDLKEKERLALQTLFYNLEALTKWLRKQQREVSRLKDVANKSRQVNKELINQQTRIESMSLRVNKFISNIPKLQLAEASFKCRGYARAVLHFEEHLRTQRRALEVSYINQNSLVGLHSHRPLSINALAITDRTSSNDTSTSTSSFTNQRNVDSIPFNVDHTDTLQSLYAQLQKIYAHVDEPDSVRGLNEMLLRPGLSELILTNEANGNWANAQSCYERLLELEPDNMSGHLGLLQCYKNQGNLGGVAMHVRGINQEHSDWRDEMIPYGIEASWRLGKWNELDDMVEERHKWTFEGALGSLLLCARQIEVETNTNVEPLTANSLSKGVPSSTLFWSELEQVRMKLTLELGTASMDSYRRSYDTVLKLHILHELESVVSIKLSTLNSTGVKTSNYDKLSTVLENRLKLTTLNFLVREPILNVRCLLLEQNLIPNNSAMDVNKVWLQVAKEARKTLYFQFAHSAILRAGDPTNTYVVMERAKLLWAQGKNHEAISLLDDHLTHSAVLQRASNNESNDELSKSDSEMKPKSVVPDIQSKIELLRVIWMEMTSRGKSELIISAYNAVVKSSPAWEKSAFYLGKYYNTIFDTEVNRLKSRKVSSNDSFLTFSVINFAHNVCRYYGKALTYGCKYYYQSMSRLLTLWLNLGRDIMPLVELLETREKEKGKKKLKKDVTEDINWTKEVEKRVTKFSQINSYILRLSSKLPGYQFLGAMSQLASRIGHNNPDVYNALVTIIGNVLSLYPQQAFWRLIAVANSTDKIRSSRVLAIFEKVKNNAISAAAVAAEQGNSSLEIKQKNIADILTNGQMVTNIFIELCNCHVSPKESSFSISTRFRSLKRMLPLNLIVPLQQSMTISYPTKILYDNSSPMFGNENEYDANGISNKEETVTSSNGNGDLSSKVASFVKSYNAFPYEYIYIFDIMDNVEVLSSLQRPRKMTIKGSDGYKYSFLCKPKDDLRKDNRLMEFNTMINMFLRKDPKSRKRKLQIRTYSVTPLNEECGLIEWVPNTIGFRSIVQTNYKSKGINISPISIKKLLESKDVDSKGVVKIFRDKVLPQFPPVFHEWFIENFPDPTQWLASRARYAATTAAMSMVGYVVGLGDRHGENILFDDQTGDCVHVDLNCLFEKGLKFEVPERVPFRLTQNMVDALGVTGTKGVFESCCDISLHILRNNKDSLMSTLETFLFDPLWEWSRKSSKSTKEVDWSSGDNEEALKALNVIQKKLDGSIVPGLPLSVEGQVRELISQATSDENLAQMYIGWMAYF